MFEFGRWVEKDVADVEAGAMVRTLVDGEKAATKVVFNRRTASAQDFVTMQVVDACGHANELTVTSTHNMLVVEEGKLRIVAAAELQIDQRFVTDSCDSSSGNATTAVIAGMERRQLSHHNELVTAHGTVLANDVLVTTICDIPEYSNYPDAESSIAAWQADHVGVYV